MRQKQLINEKQEYLDCSDAIKEWEMQEVGFDYHAVAVFGAQSSGKSTLLNHLFGTQFDVMNAKGGRGQTTKGIWMSKDSDRNILVMDVEGTDGRERGEDQDFERKSALFSLATAEVLIINMFEQTVGLYNGANMSLLRTVLEVNLQLFQVDSSSKTCLLFVLRDSTGQTPLETLADTLKTDLEKIWMSLSKPAGKESALISDFFDFSFASVAHKIFVPEKFSTDLDDLKMRFTEKENEKYLMRPKYHKRIPADGFPMFARNIWDKIITNRDLDLPSQQQLLAQFRCDEIGKSIFDGFTEKMKTVKPILESGKVSDEFGSMGTKAYEESLVLFERSASRYHTATYENKKSEFSLRLYSYLHILFLQQLRNLHRTALDLLVTRLKEGTSDKSKTFRNRMLDAKSRALDYYSSVSAASKLSSDWSYEDYANAFSADMESLIAQKRSEELKKVTVLLQKLAVSKLSEPLSQTFNSCAKEMWTEVFSCFREVSKEIVQETDSRIRDIGVEGEELKAYLIMIKSQTWFDLLRMINEELADTALLEKLRRRFDSIFRYDERGLPRIWNPTDDVESIFQKSKASVEQMMSILEKFELKILEDLEEDIRGHEDYTTDSLIFISASRRTAIMERFGREEDSLFLEAKRSTVASKAEIPTWFLALTIVLGFNEFLAIIRNPLLTAFLLMFLGGVYVIWYTNLGGPFLQIVKATTGEVVTQANSELKKRGLDSEAIIESVKAKAKEFLIYDDGTRQRKEGIELKAMKKNS